MHTKIFSATTIGTDAHLIEVEVDVSFGLVNFYIVGLPDIAIRESNKRILAALKNSGFSLPAKKITVNLAPADIKKEGTTFDLPIALGVLVASGNLEIPRDFLEETLVIGELSLDGSIRFIKGVLSIAYDARKMAKKRIILSKENAQEAALIEGLEIIGVRHITELIAYLKGELPIAPEKATITHHVTPTEQVLDFSQVKGQFQAKRALQIAAAGRHNILFIGPPGSGKTMLAKRLATILPPMLFDEVLETSKIYSITGKLKSQPLITERPFRSPHHTISQAGLIGGGSYPQPGEISLAHNGVLFLDELTEFKRDTLEALRQPLESRSIDISRVNQSINFPASFVLIVAFNPCPCGFLGDKKKECVCSPAAIERYMQKLSGPLIDRIDIQIHVQSIEYDTLKEKVAGQTSSEELYKQISVAVGKQQDRFANTQTFNGSMQANLIEKTCVLTTQAEELIKRAFDKLHLSMRGYHKILKVARTIADLENADMIDVAHIQEAILYRSLDKKFTQQAKP